MTEPGESKRDRTWKIVAAAALLLAVVATVAVLKDAVTFARTPVRQFRRHREAFAQFAAQHQDALARDNTQLRPSRRIHDAGFTMVQVKSGCLFFYFANLPPDSREYIVYAPDGFQYLPMERANDGTNQLLHLEDVHAGKWYYMILH